MSSIDPILFNAITNLRAGLGIHLKQTGAIVARCGAIVGTPIEVSPEMAGIAGEADRHLAATLRCLDEFATLLEHQK